MATSTMASLLLAAIITASRVAAATGSNASIAYWTNPNAAVIRNLIWVSGGDRYANTTASMGFDQQYVPTDGALYNISLCKAFSTADNNIDFLNEQPLYPKSNGPPWYVGGAMFATDNTFYTYGGMLHTNGSDSGVVFGQVAQENAGQADWQPGFTPDWTISDGGNVSATARDFALGGWTSAPSDELAFWFSGMRAPNYAPLAYTGDDSGQANSPATDFIMFRLGQSNQGTSYNMSWPENAKPRAEGALVWLPYNKGMLLAFGGIEIPSDQTISFSPPPYTPSNSTNTYMTDILVYDIASDTWTSQKTDRTSPDSPDTLASFCTVVASAPGNSSHQIYVYGGYDGTYTDPQASDAVWVLSIPAFRWTKISNGSPIHRRQNHVCVNMNANTMLSIGGQLESGQALLTPAFDVYDLSSLAWTSNYSPNATATYTVPATVTSNVPDMTSIPSNLESQVAKWLGLNYTGHITGPILEGCPAVASPTPTSTPTPTPAKKSIVGPAVGGAVGGAAVLAGLVLLLCCFRGRRRGNQSVDTNRNSIFSWMDRSSGHPNAPKSMPDSENTVVASPGADYFGAKGQQVEAYEMPSNVPSPGYNHSYRHGSPQIVPSGSATSPFLGSAEVDAQSRHEIMDHQPRAGSSFGPNPYNMHSVSGRQNLMSVRSDSVSHASEAVMQSRHYGYVSPYELAHDRSHDDLATPSTDLALGEPSTDGRKASTHSLGVGAEKVNSPSVMTPIAPITRTIDSAGEAGEADVERPHHKRNQSSISSNLPNLPSPGAEEDRRRSKLLETLPDRSSTATSSPVQPQFAKKSAYTEDLSA